MSALHESQNYSKEAVFSFVQKQIHQTGIPVKSPAANYETSGLQHSKAAGDLKYK